MHALRRIIAAERNCFAAVQGNMGTDPKLWAKRPISEDLLKYAAEDVQQLLMLADKVTAELGTAQLPLLSALSTVHSQSNWDVAHQDAAAACLTSFPTPYLQSRSASWIVKLFNAAK